MPGSLTVNIIMPNLWQVYGGIPGQWRVDGGAWQDSGATVDSLSDGPHVVSFHPVIPLGTPYRVPPNQTVLITDGETTVAWATYCAIAPETILETGVKGLSETHCKALNTIRSPILLMAASAMDGAFSIFGPAFPAEPNGAAYTAIKAMGAELDETYVMIFEGGQSPSDFATADELAAIAEVVAPYLTGPLPYTGGVPIRAGYKLIKRELDQWTIQRGKAFSLQPAIDAGFIYGLPVGDIYQAFDPPAPVTVSGFIVNGGGQTFPGHYPGACPGMDFTPIPGTSPFSGTPPTLLGGPNVSVQNVGAYSVTLHLVNGDGTINEVVSGTGMFNPVNGTAEFQGLNTDWYNYICASYLHVVLGVGDYITRIAPQYYGGSPDWTWTGDVLTWNGSNAQAVTLPCVMILWIGIPLSEAGSMIPNVYFTSPMSPTDPLTGNNQCAPADINARFNPFTADDYNLFWLR